MTQWGVFVGVAFSPLADFTPRASGLRRKRQCGVPTSVLVTLCVQKICNHSETSPVVKPEALSCAHEGEKGIP
jgi:hypothetical protein